MAMSRTPPRDVLKELRAEVGYCCPVTGCGNPYLTWHHFDPPWRVEHHHRPEGMIALCQEHARKADGGAFTDDQLRELKREGRSRAQQVRGKFDWMRRDLLAVVGGNFYVETMVLVQFGSRPVVWFKRDEDGYLLLNFTMPTLAGQARARIEDNVWMVTPQVAQVICPPTGRKVEIDYRGGDYFRIEFFNVDTPESLHERYTNANTMSWSNQLTYPTTGVELTERIAGTLIEFDPRATKLPGGDILQNSVFIRVGAAILLDLSKEEEARLFPEEEVGS